MNEAKADERAIRDHYFSEGYANMKISFEVVEQADNSVHLNFTIDEGKQTVISEIRFEKFNHGGEKPSGKN